MSLDELRSIAAEFGIKTNGLEASDLVYEILDQSAVASAADKVAAASKAAPAKKRTRIKTVDRVYTANQEKAKKIDKTVTKAVDDTLFGSLSNEEQALMAETQKQELLDAQANDAAAAVTVQTAEMQPAEEAPKKRGRKPGSKNKKTAEKEAKEESSQSTTTAEAETAQAEATDAEAKKDAADASQTKAQDDFVVVDMQKTSKRGRKKKESADKTPESSDNGEEFIILQDIPSEETVLQRNTPDFYEPFQAEHLVQQPKQTEQPAAVQPAPQAAPQKPKAYDFSNYLICP